MRTYRTKICKPDPKGYYRPEVGGKRFTVGHKSDISEGEAQRRRDALQVFFDQQHKQHGLDLWANWALPFALQIAQGKKPVLEVSERARKEAGQASEEVLMLDRLRSLGVDVEVTDPKTIMVGEQELRRFIEDEVRRAVEKALADATRRLGLSENLTQRMTEVLPDPAKAEMRTFHDALKAYRLNLENTGKRQDNGTLAPSPRNYIRWAKQLEHEVEDFPLWELDRTKLDELVARWRNRPVSAQTGKNISYDYAKHLLDGLWSVLTWVDESPRWKWEMPKGASRIKRTPVSLALDRKKSKTRRVHGSVYTVDQLATIAKQMNTLEKLILGVSVNCAMQPAECGRLEIDDFYEAHPETKIVGEWIVFNRPKTNEYGEWILWDEVAQLIRWGIRRARSKGVATLIVQNNGQPWYRDDWENPCARFSKWWQGNATKNDAHVGIVTKLSTEIKGFPRHTIKNLRKILPQLVRPLYGKEIADLVNARKVDESGRTGGRDTDRYADRLYEKLAEAIREHKSHFQPFLDVLVESEFDAID